MRVTELKTKICIGARIKVLHRNSRVTSQTILSLSITNRWYTDAGYYIDKDLTIQGQNGIVATCKPIPFKRFKYRYKR